MTCPKTSASVQTVMTSCILLAPKICIVATEKHKDGSDHIHIFFEFNKKLDVKNPRYFDHLIPGRHFNISTVRNTHATLRYITKDGSYTLFGITQATLKIILSGTSYTLGEVAAAIQKNPNISEIAREFPTHYIHYTRGLTSLCQIYRDYRRNKVVPFDYSRCGDAGLFTHTSLDIWFRANYIPIKAKPLRSLQLWLHGPTQLGKTRFLSFLLRHFRGFLMNPEEHYYKGYADQDYDFLFFDEFHGKKLQFLNSLLGGERIILPSKGDSYEKIRNIPVIICSNMSPAQVYRFKSVSHPLVFEAFLSRLLVLDLGKLGSIHAYVDMLEINDDI